MHIKVINSEKSIFREANIYIHVVNNLEHHVISTDSGIIAATRGDMAVSYGFMWFMVTTPVPYTVTIKHWSRDEYNRKPVLDNRRAIGDWLVYATAKFALGNVGIHVNSYNYTIDIYILDDAVAYVDDKLATIGEVYVN